MKLGSGVFHMANGWIFQGKPEIWDVRTGVLTLSHIHWVVRQHANKIGKSDTAFIWISGKDSGVVAVADILSNPTPAMDAAAEIALYPAGPPANFRGQQLRVELGIKKTFKNPIKKTELLRDPLLKDLRILRNPRGTNFALTPTEHAKLSTMARTRK